MKFFPALLATAAVVLAIPVPQPQPPGIPNAADAQSALQNLTEAFSGSSEGYNRNQFIHWAKLPNKCDVRQEVLKRDGTGVKVNAACNPTAGTWLSPYDKAIWNYDKVTNVHIDHMVPLKNAWISGASSWKAGERKAFANDMTSPQLWAVTGSINSSKGDKSPDKWKPPLKSFYCTYAKSWVNVKHSYKLTVTEAEKKALVSMLDTC